MIKPKHKFCCIKKAYLGKDTISNNSWRNWKYFENLHNGCEGKIDQTSAFRLMAWESLGNEESKSFNMWDKLLWALNFLQNNAPLVWKYISDKITETSFNCLSCHFVSCFDTLYNKKIGNPCLFNDITFLFYALWEKKIY